MAGYEGGLVAHRPQPRRDRVDQLLLVAALEIPAAHGAFEQHVADQRELRLRMMEYDVAGRVAGAVTDVEGQIADGDLVAVHEPAVRLERSASDSVLRAVDAELLN